MTPPETAARPPIGCIVEGRGEYEAYPTLVARILKCTPHTPRVNASGIGSLVRHLPEHLDDLVVAYHPCSVVVTGDLYDAIDQGLASDCTDFLSLLRGMATEWAASRAGAEPYVPLPDEIAVVAQIQSFETWWISDTDALVRLGWIDAQHSQAWRNVDEEVANPCLWLRERQIQDLELKSPRTAKQVAKALEIDVSKKHSRSFRKFASEIELGFDRWHAAVP